MAASHGREIDAAISEYLHGDEMRDRVSEASREMDASVKAELSTHVKTGDLLRESNVQLTEHESGWGMTINSDYSGFFMFNREGKRRLREPGYRRGAGIKRARGYKKHAPYMEVDAPSVFGTAIDTMNVWLDGGGE